MAPAMISSVDKFTEILRELLSLANEARSKGNKSQPLDKQHFGTLIDHVGGSPGSKFVPTPQAQYAAIETASRNILYDLIVQTTPQNALDVTNCDRQVYQ